MFPVRNGNHPQTPMHSPRRRLFPKSIHAATNLSPPHAPPTPRASVLHPAIENPVGETIRDVGPGPEVGLHPL